MKSIKISQYLLMISAVLIVLIYLKYPSINWSDKFEAVGCLISFIIIISLIILINKFKNILSEGSKKNLGTGLFLGLLWTIEISMNNIIQPRVQLRDYLDNIFWGIIALFILLISYKYTYKSKRVVTGLKTGFFIGIGSGIVACITALLLICFGMNLLLADPVNIAEWLEIKAKSSYPDMASFFAYQTFAGAIMHLLILGIIMGGLLGLIAGVIGKLVNLKKKYHYENT